MKLVTEDKVVLSSVGCVIDKSTGITFPYIQMIRLIGMVVLISMT